MRGWRISQVNCLILAMSQPLGATGGMGSITWSLLGLAQALPLVLFYCALGLQRVLLGFTVRFRGQVRMGSTLTFSGMTISFAFYDN